MGTPRTYQRIRRGVASTPDARLYNAEKTLAYLQQAARCARYAGLVFTLPRITKAVDSARGAVRNAGYRAWRQA